jgi:hypothetical protein
LFKPHFSTEAPMSMFQTLRGWLVRKRAPPLKLPEFTIAIAPPAPGTAVDLRPYTEQEIKTFCKIACPAGFEILEYPKPGDQPRVTLHLKGEPISHKHKMFIVRGRGARRKS